MSDKMNECGNNQANQHDALSPITLAESSSQVCRTSSDIKATLENESVWSRFHSLGTEMILTKQGRRMFPCCRFRLSGLDLQRKYFLVMDIMPLDDFTYRFNGKTWERIAGDEPHVLGQICVHPESPALGQQWMESPVSFYKMKLTNDSMDQDGCVLLRPMHRYLPRLHIAPMDPDSEGPIALNSPNVKTFTFPQTEFYAVTSYQNPQITQLKIDCNPFAMAFRKDKQSINLLQEKLRFCSSVGTHFQSPLLSLSWNLGGKRREGAVRSTASPGIPDNRRCGFNSASHKEEERISFKMRNGTLGCPDNMALCQENTDYIKNDEANEAVVNKCPAETVPVKHLAPLDIEPNVTVSLEENLPSTDESIPPISSTENLKIFEDAVNQIRRTKCESPTNSSTVAQSPLVHGETKSSDLSLPRPPFLNENQVHEHKPGPVLRCRRNRRGRKAKSKRWSNVKYAKPPLPVEPLNVPMQPDLEDVNGMLFVSFVAKEALNTPGKNIKEKETSLPPLSSSHDQSDNHEPENVSFSIDERISKLEMMLLLYLKQQKDRQVIHPCLQDVGLKLGLLDQKLPIDLHYLGVHLPLSPPIHEGSGKVNVMRLSSSPDAAGFFVSRTGKTNDPTKIKGWRDKFNANAVQNATEGPKNSSAFCSEMLDAYLESEAQQISDRVAVFSKCSSPPVSYQLPSKSSSYVVTLDSVLKTQSLSSSKVCSKPTNKVLPKSPPRGSPSADVSLSLEGLQTRLKKKLENRRQFADSFQTHQRTASTEQASRSMSFDPRPESKKQPGNSQLRCNSIVETASHCGSVCSPKIPAKVKNQTMLQELEEEVFCQGKVRTHITTERAKFALRALLNFKNPRKRSEFRILHKDENACSEDFCRLGCLCDSLDREIRGPTHCRRVECMFDCSCFKHKVLVLHPPKETTNVQRGRKRSVMAFPVADPEREHRPPPAPSITTLWKRTTGEHDPEPLFNPAPSYKPCSCLTNTSIQEEDKDPVYLYFESMMTCARVREYNSNPPPQLHMFPNKKQKTEPEEPSEIAKTGEPPSSQKTPEINPTETQIKPKPTKLLEILSECNWEPHRSLVLSTLFSRMNSNFLSEPFCFGMYKIQLLSTTVKGVGTSSTIIYKVCVSHADEKEMTNDLPPPLKKAMRNQSLKGFENKQEQHQKADNEPGQKSSVSQGSTSQVMQTAYNTCLPQDIKSLQNPLNSSPLTKVLSKPLRAIAPKVASLSATSGMNIANDMPPFNLQSSFPAANDPWRKSNSFVEKLQKKPLCKRLLAPLPFPTNAAPVGYLRADKKKSGSPTQVLIKVNGRTYTQAKLLLGQLGALHPANRFAAFVTDRLPPTCRGQPKNDGDVTKASLESSSVTEVANVSNQTSPDLAVARPPLGIVPEPDSKNTRTNTGPLNAISKCSGRSPGVTPIVPDGTRFVLVPVTPSNFTAASSAETVTSSTLTPGQQVVLKPAPGGQGSKFVCQYNGQAIQLKPISTAPVARLQPSSVSQGSTSQVMQTAYNTCLPQDIRSLQNPLNSSPLTNVLSKPLPVIAPNVVSLSATSGMNIANGMPAFNLQSSFPGKAGTFSFRICPPNSEGKPVGSEQVCKPQEHSDSSSTLMLPGGFTLIKLLHPAVPVAHTFNGQTPVKDSLPTAALSQENDRDASAFPHNMHKSSTGLSDNFGNLSESCPTTTKTDKQGLKEEEHDAGDRNELLKSKAAVEECDDITVDVVNLSEDDQSARFDDDEDTSTNDSEEDSSSDEDWSSDSTSSSETSDDSMDIYYENDKDRKGEVRNAKRAASSRKNIENLFTEHVLEKRLIHNEYERVRRNKMCRYFDALKKTLNIEGPVRFCKIDILNQARVMISALKERSHCLEKKKNALLQRQSFYRNKILELSENAEVKDMQNANFKKKCEPQHQLGSQNSLQTSVPGPVVNSLRLNSDGNRLPPRLGRCKDANYIPKRSKIAFRQPSITNTEKLSLPKIVLQSFSKTDIVKLTHDVRTSLPSSTEVPNSAELLMAGNLDLKDQNKKMEKTDGTRVSSIGVEKTLLSEHLNKDNPSLSSITESDVPNNSLSVVEKEEKTVVKVRKKRVTYDVVIEEALSKPDVLAPRQLRQRSTAINGGATGGRSTNKRRRII